MDPFIVFGLAAAEQAVKDSGWLPDSEDDQVRTGVMIGSGIGGLQEIAKGSLLVEGGSARKLSPFFIPAALINLISGYASIRYGFKGPNHSAVTACATGAHAIGDAARLIMLDDADVMVAGGSEAAICRLGIAGFSAAKALSTKFNDTPQKASRPWDVDRDGFVMGEGAGVVVLEEYEHAKKRGAKIYAEVVGYGLSGDAYHITAPAPNGDGAYRCMLTAFKHAKMSPDEVDYINAHGTSTPLGDEIELGAVKRVFGEARVQGLDVIDQVGRRPSPRRRRRGRGDLHDHGAADRDRPADPEPRSAVRGLRSRPGPPRRQGAAGAGGAVQLLRLRRHQRLADLHAR